MTTLYSLHHHRYHTAHPSDNVNEHFWFTSAEAVVYALINDFLNIDKDDVWREENPFEPQIKEDDNGIYSSYGGGKIYKCFYGLDNGNH